MAENDKLLNFLVEENCIRQTLIKACYYADMGRVDDMLACYTEDCTVLSENGVPVEGHVGVRGFIQAVSQGGSIPFRHYTANHVIDVEGDTAKARSYLLLVSKTDPATILMAAHYEDQWVKQGGKWRLKHRRIVPDAARLQPF